MVLSRVDGVVFTACIDEYDAATRADVVASRGWLGLTIDPARNRAGFARYTRAAVAG